MNTVFPNNKTQTEAPSSGSLTSKTILKSTYASINAALESDKKLILITGNNNQGKTALLNTINKDIATRHRVITLSGKDLPFLDKSKNNSSTELNNVQDFILESTDLGDKLVVILNDAHCLPISFLSGLVESTKNLELKNNNLQLILSGPLNFKDQLLAVEQIDAKDVTHCLIDCLNNEEIQTYIQNKTYKIASNIKQLKFDSNTLLAIENFVQSNQQLLDLILEWCAAIVKKDQLTSMTSQVVNHAISYAKQFSKDKNIPLSSSYPPFHEVYKYINDIQSSSKANNKPDKKTTKTVSKNSVKKTDTSKVAFQKTKIPIISASAPPHAKRKQHRKVNEHEDEAMPTNWVPSGKLKRSKKNSFSATTGLITFLLLAFMVFIAFQIWPDSKQVNLPKPAIAENKQNEVIVAEQKLVDEITLNTDSANSPTSSASKISSTSIGQVVEDTIDQNMTAAEVSVMSINMDKTDGVNPESEKAALDTVNNLENESKADMMSEGSALIINPKDQNNLIDKPSNLPVNIASQITGIKPTEEAEQINPAEIKPEIKREVKQDIKEEISPEIKAETTALLSQSELSELFALAKVQIENKQLSTPTGNNALETYQKILATFPNNKQATAGIKNVHDIYLGWANYYLQQNDLGRAKNFYNKALGINPSNTVAITNLQVIAQQEAAVNKSVANAELHKKSARLDFPVSDPPNKIKTLLATANEKMLQINSDINANNRNYRTYQEAQTIYHDVLRSEPQNQQALEGLSKIKMYYANWAELQIQNKNYNIALFLYGQALSIEPNNSQFNQRIEQVKALKKAL